MSPEFLVLKMAANVPVVVDRGSGEPFHVTQSNPPITIRISQTRAGAADIVPRGYVGMGGIAQDSRDVSELHSCRLRMEEIGDVS
jgi:hypothetical protein